MRVHRLLQAQPILSIATTIEELKLGVPTVTVSLRYIARGRFASYAQPGVNTSQYNSPSTTIVVVVIVLPQVTKLCLANS